jgi:methionyl aminopeptidase
LNNIAEEYIEKSGCTNTFKNYTGFPCGVCISHGDNALVHGIPSNAKLQNGDMVSFDLGATFQGAIADSALTTIYGDPKSQKHLDIIQTTKECLENAIKAIVVGKRLGVIGNAIYKTATSKGYNVVERYGGHSICENVPHAEPFVPNRMLPSDGVRLQSNMTLAIEPLLVLGSPETFVSDDKWTVFTKGSLSCHVEHTIYIHEDSPVEIITKRDNE